MSGRGSIVVAAAGVLAAVAGVAVAAAGVGAARPQQEFPHVRHEGLFTSCDACHAGIAEEEGEAWSVGPEFCANCHDGSMMPAVEWEGGVESPDNLRFSHASHPPIGCASCHGVPDAEQEMAVQAASFASCQGCHAADAESHQAAGSPCVTCHLPVAEATELPATSIAAFPAPPSHAAPEFVLAHGADAAGEASTCAVCHARESCTTCHVNADRVPAIASLQSDARIAALTEGREGRWPLPESHRAAGWASTHGAAAAVAIESCANCHVAEGCIRCHGEAGPEVIAELPERSADGPTGVTLAGVQVPGHGPGFETAHGAAAAAGMPSCGACHAESFCSDCHDGPSSPGFHPANFVTRHASEAWGATSECAECHSTEAFCRDCHAAAGAAQDGRTAGGYHDATPQWILSHGAAARQGLEACASCHEQSSCLRCHSAKSGWRVNPHGPDFDPDRVRDRSQISCARCHFASQIDGP